MDQKRAQRYDSGAVYYGIERDEVDRDMERMMTVRIWSKLDVTLSEPSYHPVIHIYTYYDYSNFFETRHNHYPTQPPPVFRPSKLVNLCVLRKYATALLFLTILCGCSKDQVFVRHYVTWHSRHALHVNLPSCMADLLEDHQFFQSLRTIRVNTHISGQRHYWLNTGAMNYDGSEDIVNEYCETVCFFCGECYPPSCLQDYIGPWVTIWKR